MKYLYQELLPGVSKRIVAVKSNKDSFVKLIAETVESMISLLNAELVAKTSTVDDLADACRVLFDPSQKYFISKNYKTFDYACNSSEIYALNSNLLIHV